MFTTTCLFDLSDCASCLYFYVINSHTTPALLMLSICMIYHFSILLLPTYLCLYLKLISYG